MVVLCLTYERAEQQEESHKANIIRIDSNRATFIETNGHACVVNGILSKARALQSQPSMTSFFLVFFLPLYQADSGNQVDIL